MTQTINHINANQIVRAKAFVNHVAKRFQWKDKRWYRKEGFYEHGFSELYISREDMKKNNKYIVKENTVLYAPHIEFEMSNTATPQQSGSRPNSISISTGTP